MKILIIDDSVFAQQYVRKAIANKYPDAEFLFAGTGELGYEAYTAHKPDYVITDLLMPGLGGQALIERIRKVDTECKIIVISSDIQKAVKDEVRSLGVTCFINKPLNQEKADMLNNILGGIVC